MYYLGVNQEHGGKGLVDGSSGASRRTSTASITVQGCHLHDDDAGVDDNARRSVGWNRGCSSARCVIVSRHRLQDLVGAHTQTHTRE